MDYKEAYEKGLTVEWKTSECISGSKCWCRIIEPKEPIIYDDKEEFYIAGSGCVPKEYAELIVKEHNENLK